MGGPYLAGYLRIPPDNKRGYNYYYFGLGDENSDCVPWLIWGVRSGASSRSWCRSFFKCRFGQGTNRFTFFFLLIHYTWTPYQAYFARIEEVNLQGPELRAVLELNPSALKQAAALDKERKLTGKRSHLHGIPVLLMVCLFFKQFVIYFYGFFRIISRQSPQKVGHTQVVTLFSSTQV